jgi:hypothetical protein
MNSLIVCVLVRLSARKAVSLKLQFSVNFCVVIDSVIIINRP